MTYEEKASFILEKLDEVLPINFNFEKFYVKAIANALREINKKEVLNEANTLE